MEGPAASGGAIERHEPESEVGGWLLRGGLCALPSLAAALAAGFTEPEQIGAMVLGIGLVSTAFAAYLTHPSVRATPNGRAVAEAFHAALRWKVILLGIVPAAAAVLLGIGAAGALPLLAPLFPDLWSGSFILGAIGRPRGGADAFFATLVITLLQGAVLTAHLVVLALAATAFSRRADSA